MLIIDAHLDLAWNALQWNRDLLSSAYTIRTQENRTPGEGRGQGTVALPEMRQGRVALCMATLLARSTGRAAPYIDYASPAQAFGIAQGQLAYYRALELAGHIRIITNRVELDHHLGEWTTWEADSQESETPPLGFVISMESADPILSPDELPEWWEAGLRVVGPAHYGPGRYAGGTSTELGLTDLGLALLSKMEWLGMILDLTHFSDPAFWEALEAYEGPVLASHNNCRTLVPHQRQFSDEQLKAIFERDGVIGAAFDAWMLQPGWVIGHSSNAQVTLADVVDHIDHICQLAGSARHAAIGTDLDGGFGRNQTPHDLDTIADLQKLVGLLAGRGYRDEDIAAIMHGNWLRLLHQSWDWGESPAVDSTEGE
ncbi:MAG: peptidase M19 [Anaerolineae bacterium]|nr:membrane dipeptidase [Anaerolineales bacterium]MCQ3972794.1 peptidase M19 [Anaerolineae bacterium]